MTTDVHDYEAMQEAQTKVREQLATYDGKFNFLLEMKSLATDPDYVFSVRQLEAIMRSLIQHNNRLAGVEVIEPVLGDKIPKGTTRHAVVNSEGKLTFIRLDKITEEGNRWQGWTFVKQIVGPNEVKIGAQRPNGEYRGQWASLLAQINDAPMETLGRYGQEIGKCGVCGLRLTDETSRKMGIGPICRDNLGV
jgi:Family of unknown function (DUF6011)